MIRNALDSEHHILFFARFITVLHTGVSIHNKHPQIVRAEKAYIFLPVTTISIRQNTEKNGASILQTRSLL
jgi:hypothetical protein